MCSALVDVIEVERKELLPLAVSVEPSDLLLALNASAKRIVSIIGADDGLAHKRCVTHRGGELAHAQNSRLARFAPSVAAR